MPERRSRPRRPYRAVVATAALAAVLAAFVPLVGAPAAEVRPLFEQVGTLERFPADARAALGDKLVPLPGKENAPQKQLGGTVIVIPPSRLLVQLFPDPGGAALTTLAVRDLDTLRIVRTLRLNAAILRSSVDPNGGGDWAHAVDDTGTRLWLLEATTVDIYEVDLRRFTVTRRPLSGQSLVGGMTYDPFGDDLLVLYSGPPSFSVANANVLLYRLDVSVPPPPSFPPQEQAKLYRLRSCTGPVTSTDTGSDTSGWDILVTEEFLYVPCQRAGHTVVVVRTPRPEANDPTHPEEVSAGPVYGDAVLADRGSGRLFVTTHRREVWVFEAATMSFVGVAATGPDNTHDKTGYGLDTDTGRVFFQSRTFGLGVVEGRFFPVPQARTMPRLVVGQERIWSDARTARVFVLEGTGQAKAPSYRIYRTAPAPAPPAPPDPDRNTTDTAERDGVTEARFNASASGYGTRVLLAKGIAGVPPQPVLGTEAPVAKELWTRPTLKPCDFADRDLFAGRVARAEYDTGATAAEAVAVAVDGNTAQDLNQPERCNTSLTTLNAERWDHEAAECASDEDEVPAGPLQGGHKTGPDLGPSSVSCPAPGRTLEASASTAFTGGAVEVAHSRTTTTIERTAAGVVSTVESAARGVSIEMEGLGTIAIGEIRSRATSTSNGRPKRDPMSTHEITIADVRLGATVLCPKACPDPVELEKTLNLAAGGRAVFRTGHGSSGRDEDLVDGSPRGAQTAVQKSVARQTSDKALIGDFTVEVPAFEVTVFNDNTNWGRARQLYQFAGVASSATYNVVVRPTGFGFEDAPGLPDDDGFAPAGAADTPYEGLYDELAQDGFALGPAATAASAGRDRDGDGGGLVGAVRALARGLRLFLTSPRTAALLLTAWALLGSPAVLSRRRRLLEGVRSA